MGTENANIELEINNTLLESEQILDGLKIVQHEIIESKALWQARMNYAQKVKDELGPEHHEIADALIQQAADYVELLDRNEVIQRAKILALSQQISDLQKSKVILSSIKEKDALYERVLGAKATKPGDFQVTPKPELEYRGIQATLFKAQALISIKQNEGI